MTTLSIITILNAWDYQETKKLVGAWERLYEEGLFMTTVLGFMAALTYILGAWKATHNQKHLLAAGILTSIGDPFTCTYMDDWTWRLHVWGDGSMSYSHERSFREHESARDAVIRWSVLIFLRSLVTLLGVWLGWKYMPEE